MLRRTANLFRRSPKAGGSWTNPTMQNTNQHFDSFLKREFGVDDMSLVDKKKFTFDNMVKIVATAGFKPQDADAKVNGGDGATHRTYLKGELKKMDKRIQPLLHDDLALDCLKTVDEIDAPNGGKVSRSFLKDKIVGLLFFSESARCAAFMDILETFHKKLQPDFVVVCISMCSRECMHVSKQHGFFHVTYPNGATWVTRDTGVMVRFFSPLPRLVILNGTTGKVITTSGVTAVVANPDTCFREWLAGEEGSSLKDWPKSWFL